MAGGSDDVLRSAIRIDVIGGDDPAEIRSFSQTTAALWERLQNGGLLQYGSREEIRTGAPSDEPQSNQPNVVLVNEGTGPHYWVYLVGTGWVAMSSTALPASHVLATNAALGGQHTITGGVAGYVLRASAAGAANFQALAFTDMDGSHLLATQAALGAQHTISGAADGNVLRASGATTAKFQNLGHGDLTGLAAGDPHTQYLLLAGRAGGQTAIGGTASGENLTLQSTAHATRGGIVLSDNTAIATTVEAYQRLAIGGTIASASDTMMTINSSGTFTIGHVNVSVLANILGGTIARAGFAGVAAQSIVRVSGGATGAGSISSLRSLEIDAFTNATGTIDVLYGLYIDSVVAGTNNYAIYTGSGYTRLGGNTAVGTTPLATQRLSVRFITDMSAAYSGFSVTNEGTGAGGAFIQRAMYAAVQSNPTIGTTQSGTVYILRSGLSLGGAGTTTNAKGLYVESVIGGTVTNLHGFYYSSPLGGGTLTNEYGFYCENVNNGTTLNYAIKTHAGVVSFGDVMRTGDGGTTDYTEFEADGTMEFNGAATVWDDMRIVPGAFSFPGTADPTLESWQPAGSGTTFKVYKFKKNDEVQASVQLSHGYKEGSDVYFHVHWTPADRGIAEGTALVGWKVDYSWANIDGTFGASATVDLSDACQSTDDDHLMTPDVLVSGTGKTISSIFELRIYRSDTGADDTWAGGTGAQSPALLEFDIHYEKDTVGSRLTLTK